VKVGVHRLCGGEPVLANLSGERDGDGFCVQLGGGDAPQLRGEGVVVS
jgi:hypothetical protein